jgi:YVTN family beta-propeller protein
MTSEMTSIRRVILLVAFTVITRSAPAQTSSPVLLVALKEEDALAVIDPQAGKVIDHISTGKDPHEVAVSADGKLAFSSNSAGDSISVIDVAARKELRRVNIGPGSRPHGISIAGSKVYFTAHGYKLIGCYNPVSNQLEWLLGTGQDGTEMLAVNKDANRIFTANGDSGTITAFARVPEPPDWHATVIPVGKIPLGIDISPDGKEVWVSQDDGDVSIVDVATMKVIQTLHLQAKRSNRVKFTPDGKRVLISDRHDGDLVVVDAVARKEIKRLRLVAPSAQHYENKPGTSPSEVLMVPDGSRAYVALPEVNHDSLAIIDLKTLEVTGHISPGTRPEGMAWVETR